MPAANWPGCAFEFMMTCNRPGLVVRPVSSIWAEATITSGMPSPLMSAVTTELGTVTTAPVSLPQLAARNRGRMSSNRVAGWRTEKLNMDTPASGCVRPNAVGSLMVDLNCGRQCSQHCRLPASPICTAELPHAENVGRDGCHLSPTEAERKVSDTGERYGCAHVSRYALRTLAAGGSEFPCRARTPQYFGPEGLFQHHGTLESPGRGRAGTVGRGQQRSVLRAQARRGRQGAGRRPAAAGVVPDRHLQGAAHPAFAGPRGSVGAAAEHAPAVRR